MENRDNIPQMVVWMATAAVTEGVKAYHKAQKEYDKQTALREAGQPYSYLMKHAIYESVEVAAEVLWKLFQSCPIDCQDAINLVAQKHDGFTCLHGYVEYFDAFIVALEEIRGLPATIRTAE